MSDSGLTLSADLSGLSVRFRGLDDALAAELSSGWAPYLAADRGAPWLDVEVGVADRAIVTGRPMRPEVKGDVREGAGRFRSDEGELEVDAGGRVRVLIGRGDIRWRYWGLNNLVAAALAVRLPSRPGALVHAAGIVVDGRAFLLVGPEGAGKSTFARAARQAGARVVSDDAVLVDGGDGPLCLLGSPIRAHEASEPAPGRWPVAAFLHARWGPKARLDSVGRVSIEAVVTANLPFLATAWGHDARLDALVPYLAETVPHRRLTFAPDPSFVELLRAGTF